MSWYICLWAPLVLLLFAICLLTSRFKIKQLTLYHHYRHHTTDLAATIQQASGLLTICIFRHCAVLHKSNFSSTFSQTPNKYKSNHKGALQSTAPMHWTLLPDSRRAVCYVPSATDTDLFPCAQEFCSRQRLVAVRAWSKLSLSFGEHRQRVRSCLGQTQPSLSRRVL